MKVRISEDQKITVSDPDDLYIIMQGILLRENKIQRGQEHFWIVGLNNAKKILYIELIALGGLNRVHTRPRDLFRMGIYKLAVSVILVHNHPSDSLIITEGDKNCTALFLKSGKMLGIEVLDHLVITEKSYVSFAGLGIIEELKNSDLFEIVGPEYKEQQEREQRKERKKAEKENSLEIAKRMKVEGYDDATIKKLTGLSLSEIKKL